jgi:lysophospholipase L1-like esterase
VTKGRWCIGFLRSILPWLLLPGQAIMPHTASLKQIKVVLVGDSTVATQGGWGPGFCVHLGPEAECLDLAANGRSTKSFLDEGLWSQALARHGQFYFIQFGHNDQKDRPALHTDPESTFKTNLKRYLQDVRHIGGEAVLVTSLTRRNFQNGQLLVDPLREYAAATREVAAEEHVPLLDLYQLSRQVIEPMTQEQADRFNMVHHEDATAEGATATTPDRTHLNALGQQTFGDMVAQAAYRNVPALRPYLQVRPPHGPQ